MGGYQLLHLYTTSRNLKLLLARPIFPTSVRKYSKENYEHHAEEKAPTTAEEFIRVAEEMAEEKVDKAQDGIKEDTATDDSNFESVKESFKEPPGNGNFHKKGEGLK